MSIKSLIEAFRTGYRQAIKIHEAKPDLTVSQALQASREYKANRQAGLDPDEARKRIA